MSTNNNLIRKIRILITNQFDTPEEALDFFDSKSEGRFRKTEIKKILRLAAETGFIKGIVAQEILKGYDKPSDDTINWEELKSLISDLESEL
ncbi:EF-hand domain-containing protein [uncultured Polaribacter sp.]|uniref:EF-hand domain-containing protein n=1 Tax=uncultured Polaribacter sp. TaxID=174711 RepID=UPI0030DA90AD|tara:strand:+ start:260 stop:535 length:276 start_codon:yes stop_codon:yes gene_type:complete